MSTPTAALTPHQIATTLLSRPAPPNIPLEPFSSTLKTDIDRLPSDTTRRALIVAALHLANDDVHACHRIVGMHEGDEDADLMHLTMHRREGDFWNAAWWINNIPPHSSSTSTSPSIPSTKLPPTTFSPHALRRSLKQAESVGATPGARSGDGKVEDGLWAEVGGMVWMVLGRGE